MEIQKIMAQAKEKKENNLEIEKIESDVAEMLANKRLNNISKIEAKCWLYHSKSRLKNGNQPFTFQNYSRNLGHHVPLEYIKYGLIDVSDLGGQEMATNIVKKWYGLN